MALRVSGRSRFAACLKMAAAMLCATAMPGLAEGRLAYLLGSDGDTKTELSRAFFEAGYDVSRQSWDGQGALPTLMAPEDAQIVLYVQTLRADAGTRVLRAAEGLREKGARNVLVVSERCATWPTDNPLGVSLVAPEQSATGCAPLTTSLAERLKVALTQPGTALDLADAPVTRRGIFRPLTDPVTRRAAAPVVIGGALGASAALASPIAVTPVAVTPGAVQLGAVSPVVAQPALQVTSAQPAGLLRARATPDGLPRPSIIVGVLGEPDETDAPEAGILSGDGLATDTYDARESFRQTNPDGYPGLVASGAFDPTPDALPASLQRALQRMGCYRLRIDGDWGNGSRTAVDLYYRTRGSTAPDREASIALFRDVILREDVTCPAPAVVAAPRASTSGGGATRTLRATQPRRTNQTAAAPRRAAPVAPARQSQAPARSGGIRNTAIIGGFR